MMTMKTKKMPKRRNTGGRLWAASLTTLAAVALTGCGMGLAGPSAPTTIAGTALHGGVMGGQQPVSSSTIQLYAAGTSGYGSGATPLLSPAVTSDQSGGFNITGKYTCPSASTQVYITATGGNSGSGNNANLAMMAALGSCGSLSASTYIFINELTTVGSVWALAPFMTGPANIGSSSTNASGLANAFADVNTLVNTATGTTPGASIPSGTTVPTTEINTLGDVLAACVNSAGGTGAGTPCGMLFTAAKPATGSTPTDTITAAVDIAQNPGRNVTAIYNLASPTAPFQPTLSTAPNDFTIAVNFTAGGSLSAPSALAADSGGNIWIANSLGNTVTELSHAGTLLSGTGYVGSLNAPSAIAFDLDGTVWITNKGNSTVSRLSSTGTPVSGSPYSGGNLASPSSIAFDSLGTAWISNSAGANLTSITTSGSVASYTPAGLAAGNAVSVGVTPH